MQQAADEKVLAGNKRQRDLKKQKSANIMPCKVTKRVDNASELRL